MDCPDPSSPYSPECVEGAFSEVVPSLQPSSLQWVRIRSGGQRDGVLVQGTLGQEQVVSSEVDLEKLRRYREEGIPPMLKDRRPEFYRRFLYTEAEDRAATP